MNAITTAILSFVLIGFSILGIAVWAVMHPKIKCQEIKSGNCEYNVCVRHKLHSGPHTTATGKKFEK